MSSLAYLKKCKAEKMAYWDRAKVAKTKGLVFKVFVPVDDAAPVAHIAPGSGIVGVAEDEYDDIGRKLVYYEGGIYSAVPREYIGLVANAADRMATAYPTIACAVVPKDTLVEVGYFDYATQQLVVTDQVALDAWTA